jgi:hypothetical protein
MGVVLIRTPPPVGFPATGNARRAGGGLIRRSGPSPDSTRAPDTTALQGAPRPTNRNRYAQGRLATSSWTPPNHQKTTRVSTALLRTRTRPAGDAHLRGRQPWRARPALVGQRATDHREGGLGPPAFAARSANRDGRAASRRPPARHRLGTTGDPAGVRHIPADAAVAPSEVQMGPTLRMIREQRKHRPAMPTALYVRAVDVDRRRSAGTVARRRSRERTAASSPIIAAPRRRRAARANARFAEHLRPGGGHAEHHRGSQRKRAGIADPS